MRRVLKLKMVTQCAMLEEFDIFLVLANKVSTLSKNPYKSSDEGHVFVYTVIIRLPY